MAVVSVKLVSEVGVGVIAAGVAKVGRQVLLLLLHTITIVIIIILILHNWHNRLPKMTIFNR